MAPIDLPYLQSVKNPTGKVFWYYRRAGKRKPLPGAPGSAEFLAAYWKLRSADDAAPKPVRGERRDVIALVKIYYASPAFKALKSSTQRTYRVSLNEFADEFGPFLVSDFRFKHISKYIGDMADRPGAANKMLKRLRTLFELARRLEWTAADPCEGVRLYKLGEIHTWTDDEIQAFKDRWAPGTRQRLAFMLQLHTGQRNSDIVCEPWPRDGKIRITQEKTGRHLWLPISRDLAAELDLHPKEHAVILSTAYGEQRTAAGYGNFMRKAIADAGLPARCSPHGLRKAAATHLAEAGCSSQEIQAITGHASLAEVERYTRAVDQEKMAEIAVAKRDQAERD